MTTQPDPQVAGAVRAELARAGKTQGALTAVLHLSQPAISRRLSGQVPFTIDELSAAAAFLDIPLSTLVPQAVAA